MGGGDEMGNHGWAGALDEARAALVRMASRRQSDDSVRRSAEANLTRRLEQLRDAVDEALDAGVPWPTIAAKLRLETSPAPPWLSDT